MQNKRYKRLFDTSSCDVEERKKQLYPFFDCSLLSVFYCTIFLLFVFRAAEKRLNIHYFDWKLSSF